jgi:hypothetical protein
MENYARILICNIRKIFYQTNHIIQKQKYKFSSHAKYFETYIRELTCGILAESIQNSDNNFFHLLQIYFILKFSSTH